VPQALGHETFRRRACCILQQIRKDASFAFNFAAQPRLGGLRALLSRKVSDLCDSIRLRGQVFQLSGRQDLGREALSVRLLAVRLDRLPNGAVKVSSSAVQSLARTIMC
jgi:hypothetical protein